MSIESRPAGSTVELAARSAKTSTAKSRREAILEQARAEGAEIEEIDGKVEIRRGAKKRKTRAK